MIATKLFALAAVLPFVLASPVQQHGEKRGEHPNRHRRQLQVRDDDCGGVYTTTVYADATTTTEYTTPTSTTAAATTTTSASTSTGGNDGGASSGFVSASGTSFQLNGKPYCFAGFNAYWMPQLITQAQYDEAFAQLANAGIRVLRTWAFSMVMSVPSYDLTYFQLWNGNSFTVNTGANGLERMDMLLNSAASHGIKVILTLTNNWNDFGGMEMYTAQTGCNTTYHSSFYTCSAAVSAFDSYIDTIVGRYKDHTGVFGWQIANEPRNGGNTAADPSFTISQMTQWISDRAAHIKSIDSNHMVSIGDEGFFNNASSSDWLYEGYEGMDFVANLKLSNIDWGTFHLYPEAWSETTSWGDSYIQAHIDAQNNIGKPVVFEEFNMDTYAEQQSVLPGWIDLAVNGGLAGFMPWQYGGENINITGTTVYTGDAMDISPTKSDLWSKIQSAAATMNARCPQ